ncbi:MAG: IS1634 family transposase [Gammaproteobacteria bacterium]|nr:IS1634 family transposase [Gammaproteobacteria bacterium]
MSYNVGMYVATIPNRSSPPAILLRESYREDGKVKSRTLANLTQLPTEAIALLKRYLAGERFISATEAFGTVRSWHHGHVQAVREAMTRVGFDRLIGTRRCRERDLVIAMVAARILEPESKLATTRWWPITTLPRMLGVETADEQELYAAMDWLLERQDRIEKKLAARHLEEGGLVLYDLSSSYMEGQCCSLAMRGHNRDGKKGKLQVNYGLLTDDQGCPVSVSVFEGNTCDGKTLLPQVERVQQQFGIQHLAIVGDRGMISQTQIDQLKEIPKIDWISALRSSSIKKLVDAQAVQPDLFDTCNLFALTHPDYPGERLIACRNPVLAERRANKRQALLEATTRTLKEVQAIVERGKLKGEEKIGQRVKKILGSTGVGEYFALTIDDGRFEFRLLDPGAAADTLLDAFGKRLDRLRTRIERGTLRGRKAIETRLTRISKQHKLQSQVSFEVREDGFDFRFCDPEEARQAAIAGFCEALQQVRVLVEQGRYGGRDKIGLRLGKIIDKYKVGKHFVLAIRDDGFAFSIDEPRVAAEAALDGIYIVRTSLEEERLSAEDTVRSYKRLSQVERAFRSIKTMDLKVRPIYHYLEPRVRAHLFLCMLAYYVEWYMREAWRPLLFCDEDQEAKSTRDPVAPAERSEAAMQKVHTQCLADGTAVHSFQSLIHLLSGIVLNLACVPGMDDPASTFEIITTPNETQQQAIDLLKNIRM